VSVNLTASAQAGQTTTIQLSGTNLAGVTRIDLAPADDTTVSNLTTTSTTVRFDLTVGPNAAYGDRKVAVYGPAGESNQITLNVYVVDPTLVISNLVAGPGTNSPYAVVPVSFDYNDGKGLMVNGATYHYNISNGGILVTASTYSGTSSGTRSTTLDFSAFSIRWVSGQTVPISVWLESPAGRRSNTLSGGFQTQ
jgi:hypothetical protein